MIHPWIKQIVSIAKQRKLKKKLDAIPETPSNIQEKDNLFRALSFSGTDLLNAYKEQDKDGSVIADLAGSVAARSQLFVELWEEDHQIAQEYVDILTAAHATHIRVG